MDDIKHSLNRLENITAITDIETMKESLRFLEQYCKLNPIKGTDNDYKLVEAVFNVIMCVPGFKNQVEVINFIMALITPPFQKALFNYVVIRFDKICFDFRDKFYYLFDRCWHLLNFEERLSFANQDILSASIRNLRANKPNDWNDEIFLNFLCSARPWVYDNISNIKINEEKVRPILKNSDLTRELREALYRLFE